MIYGHAKINVYMWRLLILDSNTIYKKVLLIRIAYHLNQQGGIHGGPVKRMLDLVKKYGIADIFNACIGNGIFENKASFKNKIQKLISEYEHDSLVASLLLYKRIPACGFGGDMDLCFLEN